MVAASEPNVAVLRPGVEARSLMGMALVRPRPGIGSVVEGAARVDGVVVAAAAAGAGEGGRRPPGRR